MSNPAQDKLLDHITSGKNFVFQSPCNTGKTTIFLQLAQLHRDRANDVTITVILVQPFLSSCTNLFRSLPEEYRNRPETVCCYFTGGQKEKVTANTRLVITTPEHFVKANMSQWLLPSSTKHIKLVVADELDILVLHSQFRGISAAIGKLHSLRGCQVIQTTATLSNHVWSFLQNQRDVKQNPYPLFQCISDAAVPRFQWNFVHLPSEPSSEGNRIADQLNKQVMKLIHPSDDSSQKGAFLIFAPKMFEKDEHNDAQKKRSDKHHLNPQRPLDPHIVSLMDMLTNKGTKTEVYHSETTNSDGIKSFQQNCDDYNKCQKLDPDKCSVIIATETLSRVNIQHVQNVILVGYPDHVETFIQEAERVSRGDGNRVMGTVHVIQSSQRNRFKNALMYTDEQIESWEENLEKVEDLKTVARFRMFQAFSSGEKCTLQALRDLSRREYLPNCNCRDTCTLCLALKSQVFLSVGLQQASALMLKITEIISSVSSARNFVSSHQELAKFLSGITNEPLNKALGETLCSDYFGLGQSLLTKANWELLAKTLDAAGLLRFDKVDKFLILTDKGSTSLQELLNAKTDEEFKVIRVDPVTVNRVSAFDIKKTTTSKKETEETNGLNWFQELTLTAKRKVKFDLLLQRVHLGITEVHHLLHGETILDHPETNQAIVIDLSEQPLIRDDASEFIQLSLQKLKDVTEEKQKRYFEVLPLPLQQYMHTLDDSWTVRRYECQGSKKCSCGLTYLRSKKIPCNKPDCEKFLTLTGCSAKLVIFVSFTKTKNVVIKLQDCTHPKCQHSKTPKGLMDLIVERGEEHHQAKDITHLVIQGKSYAIGDLSETLLDNKKIERKLSKRHNGTFKDIPNHVNKAYLRYFHNGDDGIQVAVFCYDRQIEETNAGTGVLQGDITYNRIKNSEGYKYYLFNLATKSGDDRNFLSCRGIVNGQKSAHFLALFNEIIEIIQHDKITTFLMDFDKSSIKGWKKALTNKFGEEEGIKKFDETLQLCYTHFLRLCKKRSAKGSFPKLFRMIAYEIPNLPVKEAEKALQLLNTNGLIDVAAVDFMPKVKHFIEKQPDQKVNVKWDNAKFVAFHKGKKKGIPNENRLSSVFSPLTATLIKLHNMIKMEFPK